MYIMIIQIQYTIIIYAYIGQQILNLNYFF